MTDDEISDTKKTTFIAKVQAIIEVIEKSRLKSDDNKWLELEQQVRTAKQLASEHEDKGNQLGVILATILVANFRQYLDPADYTAMKEKLEKYNTTTDKYQKESLANDLDNTANQYGILLNTFLYKLVGDNANNPKDAARANCAFDEMMRALQIGDVASVHRIQSQNQDLLSILKKEKIDWGTGIK